MNQVFHPNAWLSGFRNVKPGLERRTEILLILENDSDTAKQLSEKINVTYSTILYHLHHLESKSIVKRTDTKPPYKWKIEPVGQQRLNTY